MQLRARVFGDEEVIAFLDAALPEVYGYLLRRVHNKATAEDLTSEALLAALQRIRLLPPDSICVAWVIGIARHKLVDHWRGEERQRRYLSLLSSPPDVTTPQLGPQLGMAHEVLALLNPSQRTVLTLRHVDGLSVPEVAAHIERSVHATETLLARARSAFRGHYYEKAHADE